MLSEFQGKIQIAPHIARLRPYSPGKPIEEVQREHGLSDIIKLASNENPLGPSEKAIAAMREACSGVALYPDDSCYHLRRALSRHLQLDPEMIIFGNGSDEMIHCLGLAFLEPGDEVVEACPTFSRYGAAAALGQARDVVVPLRDHKHDLEAMAAAFNERTRLVFIGAPNNPTGTINTRQEIERLLDRLPARAIVVFDEAYHEYVESPDYPDARDYVRAGMNVVVLRTFSKAYGLAGLRIGYAYARPQIVTFLNQVREPFNANSVAQAGALASLEDPDQVRRSREMNSAGKVFLYAAFKEMGLAYIPSEANFIAVDVVRPAREICAGLEKKGVIVRSCESFGVPHFIRVTIGTIPECRRFIGALREVIAQPK